MKNRFYFFVSFLFVFAALLACVNLKQNPTSGAKTDIAGQWLVTRTLVTANSDFPKGYQDQQDWSFTVKGDTATLITSFGSMRGKWQTSDNFNFDHWVFQAEGPDPRTGSQILVRVEIISVDYLKGTNETYYKDPHSSRYLLLDSFKIEGVRR